MGRTCFFDLLASGETTTNMGKDTNRNLDSCSRSKKLSIPSVVTEEMASRAFHEILAISQQPVTLVIASSTKVVGFHESRPSCRVRRVVMAAIEPSQIGRHGGW